MVPFNDIHNNINHHAITYSGHEFTSTGQTDFAYSIVVVSNLTTQYYLALTLYGTTTLTQIQFFLILIGNEGSGIIEAVTLSTNELIYR
jgi:hypothetical protein